MALWDLSMTLLARGRCENVYGLFRPEPPFVIVAMRDPSDYPPAWRNIVFAPTAMICDSGLVQKFDSMEEARDAIEEKTHPFFANHSEADEYHILNASDWFDYQSGVYPPDPENEISMSPDEKLEYNQNIVRILAWDSA